MIKRLDKSQSDFWQSLENLLAWESVSDDKVEDRVVLSSATTNEAGTTSAAIFEENDFEIAL